MICPLSLSFPIFKMGTQKTAMRMKATCKLERVLHMYLAASKNQPLPQAPTMWVHVTFANNWESYWELLFPHETKVALPLCGL